MFPIPLPSKKKKKSRWMEGSNEPAMVSLVLWLSCGVVCACKRVNTSTVQGCVYVFGSIQQLLLLLLLLSHSLSFLFFPFRGENLFFLFYCHGSAGAIETPTTEHCNVVVAFVTMGVGPIKNAGDRDVLSFSSSLQKT